METVNHGDSARRRGFMTVDIGDVDMPSVIGVGNLKTPAERLENNRLGLQDDVQIESRLQPDGRQTSDEWVVPVVVSCTVVAAVAIVALITWWLYRRRRQTKISGESAASAAAAPAAVHAPAQQQLSNNNNNNNYHKVNGVIPMTSLRVMDELCDAMTEYGSIAESFPPSPTLSFRSVIDGPGFNRSRAGTGTSFGTVASFASDRTSRSRASTVASYKTCYEDQMS